MNNSFKLLSITLLALSLFACGSSTETKKHNFSLQTNAKNNVITLGETLNLSIKNPKNETITAVSYKINDKQVSESFATNDLKLGVQTLTATISYDDTTADVSTKITVLNNTKPKIYTYKIVNTYPHDITSYTQGLEFYNGELYESTGQYRESKLRKVDYKTAEVLKNINLQSQYFGEGLTVLNDKIYQLTWRENTGFVYDVNSFEKLSSFTYGKSNEGWGLCNDGTRIFKSDGTENIWLLNPETLAEEETIQVYREKGKVVGLNELEWVNGKIYSNLYQFNGVAIINPKNGAMEAVIDFSPLRKLVTQHQGLDVLNGIAYNPDTNTLFVTGKRWDKLFEVEIIEQ
ncbi:MULTISPECIES: glutaminyl-peptide cyclotransferase [Meridianimaribacter]|jgi:glutaminyl-peptide cyclotransferase|uniref:Glutamine cyclotransferase n=1 Tax=Meridianimaribacter flavus TaxID=571115 RepID=A0ABY2G6B0_9FLAO|nr:MULTISPECIES: glutaminyl-peptide cyclotransferase [Meridianimaribacter]TBV26895.1 glutaminyl-peptide cyclotransferase [Meridianimaribacter sp. CL38]TDY12581.1 glutamine cyclotransferase [Meridianimaribacter flavus]